MKGMTEALELIQKASKEAMKALEEGNLQALGANYEWAAEIAAAAREGRPLPQSPASTETAITRRAAEVLQKIDEALVQVEMNVHSARHYLAKEHTSFTFLRHGIEKASKALGEAHRSTVLLEQLHTDLEALKLSNRTD